MAQALTKGAAFIAKSQAADGSFASSSSPTQTPFEPIHTYQTTFHASLILAALSSLHTPIAMSVRNRLADWLLNQKSPNWSFNYWAKGATQHKTLPYPDDLDDTFCALIGLFLHQPSLINPACLAKIVQLLLATESVVGGPYRTWLVATSASNTPEWQDVDLAVNSNVACLLGWVAEPLPNLTTLMDKAIDEETLASPYYPNAYPLVYYLARAPHGRKAKLEKYILKHRKDGYWQTPMQTALAVTALQRLGTSEKAETAIEYLIDCQKSDGSWGAEAFCLDPALDGQTYYNGSSALTTALVMEALSPLDQKPRKQPTVRSKKDSQAEHIHSLVWGTAQQQLTTLDSDLQRASLVILADTKARDKRGEIALLPLFFARSLHAPLKTPEDLLINLGLANVYGWMAYTIYDDFLDDEGDPKLLSAANVALRYSMASFRRALPEHTAFQYKVLRTFDVIDGANMWEVAHARCAVKDDTLHLRTLPRYGNAIRLAERSIGHALPVLGLIAAQDIKLDDPGTQQLEAALKDYLIARQLSDDLHDWEADVRAGRCSFVVTKILKDLKLAPGLYPLSQLIPRMQRQFWHETLGSVCELMARRISRARQRIEASRLFLPSTVLHTLLEGLETVIRRTQQEQSKAKDFLSAYRTS